MKLIDILLILIIAAILLGAVKLLRCRDRGGSSCCGGGGSCSGDCKKCTGGCHRNLQ